MQASQCHLGLMLGPDEQPFDSPTSQNEFNDIYEAMKAHGLVVEPRILVRKSAGSGVRLLGEFLVPIAQVGIPALAGILVGWLQGRASRKVRIKVGDVEAEAGTLEELETLLQRAQEFKTSAERGGESKP